MIDRIIVQLEQLTQMVGTLNMNPPQPNFPPNDRRPQNMDLVSQTENEQPEIVQIEGVSVVG